LDLYDGRAWLAVTPFHMSGVRMRAMPPIPRMSAFPELNVRTYVRFQGVPGVYFFSLDAASRMAVIGARATYFLPYFHAEMKVEIEGETIRYESRRRSSAAEFRGRYRPISAPRQGEKNSLEHFLTERYCLYSVTPSGRLLRADIHHLPWPLQDAEAEIAVNTMAEAAGIRLPNEQPLLHFAKRLEVLVWWPQRAARAA
jgi:uncharacterized protein YqjF (DUF2071 family)